MYSRAASCRTNADLSHDADGGGALPTRGRVNAETSLSRAARLRVSAAGHGHADSGSASLEEALLTFRCDLYSSHGTLIAAWDQITGEHVLEWSEIGRQVSRDPMRDWVLAARAGGDPFDAAALMDMIEECGAFDLCPGLSERWHVAGRVRSGRGGRWIAEAGCRHLLVVGIFDTVEVAHRALLLAIAEIRRTARAEMLASDVPLLVALAQAEWTEPMVQIWSTAPIPIERLTRWSAVQHADQEGHGRSTRSPRACRSGIDC